MEAGVVSRSSFDRLRVHSIGLPQVLFQSITHMAPAAAVAYSIYISVPSSKQALALSVLLALIACLCAATAIGQLAKLEPSAGGLYAYAARSLGPCHGILRGLAFALSVCAREEAAGPLGQESKCRRRPVPLAVGGAAPAIGLFYVLRSFGWVFGAGFSHFVDQASGADPCPNPGK